jgi:HK97 family phage portal protein
MSVLRRISNFLFEPDTKTPLEFTKSGQVVGQTWADVMLDLTMSKLAKTGFVHVDPYNQNAWAFASIDKIAKNISRLDFNFERFDNSGNSEPVTNVPFEKVLNSPCNFLGGCDLRYLTSVFLETCGEAFWILDRNAANQIPERIVIAKPNEFEEITNKEKSALLGWKFTRSGQSMPLETFQVIHFKYPNINNAFRGLSPHKAIRTSLELELLSDEFHTKYFKQGALVGSRIETTETLTDEQFDRMKKEIDQTFGQGVRNAHKPILLEGGAKFNNSQLSLKDLAFKDLADLTRKQIFAAYGTNDVVLGFFDDVKSEQGTKQIFRTWWTDNLIPRIDIINNSIQTQFIDFIDPSIIISHNIDSIEVLQEDFDLLLERGKKLFEMGYPLNQINTRLGLNMEEVDWGDVAWYPKSLQPISSPDDAFMPIGFNDLPEEGQEEPVIVDEEAERSFIRLRDIHWQRFLTKQNKVERETKSKIDRWLFEQRKKVLANLEENLRKDITTDVLDPEDEIQRLIKLLDQLYDEALTLGVELTLEELGILDDPELVETHLAFKRIRLANVPKGIVTTIEKNIRKTLIEGLAKGEALGDLQERVRGVYNVSRSRTLTIARTESASMINGGKFIEMKKRGVEQTMWITAGDENVRDSHAAQDGVTRPLNTTFPNGQKYPNEDIGIPEEFINCRCTAVVINRFTDVE